MEERILKIMKDAEAQRIQEEQKTKQVLKEMQQAIAQAAQV